jgi:DNA-binding SARP family transcriptional activator
VLEFRILGPLEVIQDGRVVPVTGRMQRAVLALLLLEAGEVVSVDRLVDALWGERPPRTAVASLQNFVSQLRKLVGSDVVKTTPPGYVLELEAEQLDLDRFTRLVKEARSAGAEERARRLRDALALWRGPPLAEFAYESFARAEIERLEELRLEALEARIDAELELGRHRELVAELESLVTRYPLRERLRGQLMLALYRCDRQAEALETYQDARRRLVDELGIVPGSALQNLYRAVLRQEGSLEPTAPPRLMADHYDEVVEALLSGRLVAVLGSGVNRCGRGEGDAWEKGECLPDELEVASHLARAFGYPATRPRELPRVSQYVAVTRGVGRLYDELHDVYDRDYAPGPVHRFLAELPGLLRARGVPSPVIVLTGYDHAVERALTDTGETFDVVSYIAVGRERGRFLHTAPDGTRTVVERPNRYADLAPEGNPILFKVYGAADPTEGRDRDSFVVSEDDYIDYLAQADFLSSVPVTLAAKLRRSHFLFLGYPFDEWHLRVFLLRVWRDEKVGYRSWAVDSRPDVVQREFWRQWAVDLYDVPLDEYVEELRDRIAAASQLGSET